VSMYKRGSSGDTGNSVDCAKAIGAAIARLAQSVIGLSLRNTKSEEYLPLRVSIAADTAPYCRIVLTEDFSASESLV
jgi:hypothetical protein